MEVSKICGAPVYPLIYIYKINELFQTSPKGLPLLAPSSSALAEGCLSFSAETLQISAWSSSMHHEKPLVETLKASQVDCYPTFQKISNSCEKLQELNVVSAQNQVAVKVKFFSRCCVCERS